MTKFLRAIKLPNYPLIVLYRLLLNKYYYSDGLMDTFPSSTLSIFTSSLFLSSGVVFLAAIQFSLIGLLGSRNSKYWSFSIICFITFFFHIGMIILYSANNLESAALGIKIQGLSASLFIPIFIYFCLKFLGLKINLTLLKIIGVYFGVLFFVIFLGESNWRFSDFWQNEPYIFSWGEKISSFGGTINPLNLYFMKIPFSLCLVWIGTICILQFFRMRRLIDLFMCISIIFLLLANVWGTLIDLRIFNGVYVIHFWYLVFILIVSIHLSLEIKNKSVTLELTTQSLYSQLERRVEIETAIKKISSASYFLSGDKAYEQILLSIKEIYCAEFIVLQIFEVNGELTFSMCQDGQVTLQSDSLKNEKKVIEKAKQLFQAFAIFQDPKRILDPVLNYIDDENACCGLFLPLESQGEELGCLFLLTKSEVDNEKYEIEVINVVQELLVKEIKKISLNNELNYLAFQDKLTDLPNRQGFYQKMKKNLDDLESNQRFSAIILMDLDHFKHINEVLSHDFGDQVLKVVAIEIKECVQDKGDVARLGGDEFAILLRESFDTEKEAENMAIELSNEIIRSLAKNIKTQERTFALGASIGITTIPDEKGGFDPLRKADMALYAAKFQGRSSYQVYQDDFYDKVKRKLELQELLHGAIENQELSLVFQPQCRHDGRCIGCEALLRWNNSQLGGVSPVEFIPVAEESGLIMAIGSWVLESACRFIVEIEENDLSFSGRVSINVSTWQFSQHDFVSYVVEICRRFSVSPKKIMLELTESGVLYDINDTIKKFDELRNHGFTISLDDFGTGYSSLSHLKQLPLDELKIDQAFISDIESKSNLGLVKSLLDIGENMSINVIAEGVETKEQLNILVKNGTQLFQGYFFSKPLSKEDFFSFLTKQG